MKGIVIMLGFTNLVISLLPLYYEDKEKQTKTKKFEISGNFFIGLISFLVGIAYLYFPNWVFYKGYECFFQMNKKKKNFLEKEYGEIKTHFSEDYSSVHPILKVGEIEKKIKMKKSVKENAQTERRNTLADKRKITIFDTIKKENDKKSQS